MFRARSTHPAGRAAVLTALLVLSAVAPAAGASPVVAVTTTSSPTSVTVGLVVAYPITVTNRSKNTLNHVTLAGSTSSSVAYLGASPDGVCSQTQPTCDFGQMGSGAAVTVSFYYRAPSTPGSFVFTAVASVSEGGTDNPNASHEDMFSKPITTDVLALNQDLARGHSFGGDRTFTTGLTTLGTGNPHGTQVRIPSANVEVTVADLPPDHPDVQCPPALTTCFGSGSSHSVGGGGPIAGGIEVTTRWDYSELATTGITEKKLRVAHLLGNGQYQQVTGTCNFVAGVPTNMPCFSVLPFRLPDKDIQATFYLASNRVTRGY